MLNKKQIQYTFQLIACVLVALEISIPPNPYKEELILVLTILICIKHDLPNKILKSIENLINRFT
jgi:hypothetical protein